MTALKGTFPRRRATLLQWLVDSPGRLSHWWTRPRPPLPASPLSRNELAPLVHASPRANGILSLEKGLSIFGTEDAAISWAGSGRTAFACGGVHGADITPVIQEFVRALKGHGFRRALLFPISDSEREACTRGGFPSVRVGMEAFIYREGFDLRGRTFVDLRQMLNRARKRHHLGVWEVTPDVDTRPLEWIHKRWLHQRPTWTPMALVVGSPSFDAPLGRRYFAVGDRTERKPCAFISLGQGWSGRGWGLDVMARDPDAPAGAMELVITEAATRMFEEGADIFSLGAAPLYSGPTNTRQAEHRLETVMRWIFHSRLANRFFHFESLARFKMKFAPTWEPVFIGIWPRPSIRALYGGCRMWGLFGRAHMDERLLDS